jgi:hypothetical protein
MLWEKAKGEDARGEEARDGSWLAEVWRWKNSAGSAEASSTQAYSKGQGS